MDIKVIDEPWYHQISKKHGAKRAVEAGYFQETKPWGPTYTQVFGRSFLEMPKSTKVIIQFSGAFFPFHDGHLETIQKAVTYLAAPMLVVVHVDHMEYRHSKGAFNEDQFVKSFDLAKSLQSEHAIDVRIVFEDKMPGGCSRNFTRLYQELIDANPNTPVWFLAGGDRAQFCLSFADDGHCLIVGRGQGSKSELYKNQSNDRIVFLTGNNMMSSTDIRNENG